MPASIQRVPIGLLDHLGIKSTGDNPSILTDSVIPTVDLTPMYLINRWEYINVTTAVAGAIGVVTAATPTDLQVPNGQLWIVQDFSVRSAAIPAATSYRLTLVAFNAQTGIPFAFAPLAQTSGVGEAVGINWPGPIVLRPGEACGVFVQALTLGVAQAFFVSGRVAKLTI